MILAAKAATGTQSGLDYRWVYVAQGGQLYTSDNTNGSSWTSRTSSFSTTSINGVASNGTSLYVAVGNSGTLATSPDAITWTQRTSSFSTSAIRAVAYGNGYWVAVGASGKIATSTDGTTWTQRTSPTGNQLECVSYGNNVWVASGASGTVISTGSDPTTGWTTRTSTLTNNGIFNHYSTLGTIWVAGHDDGTTGAFASSTDGTTWTARTSAVSLTYGGNRGGADNDADVIVLGASASIQTSTNGTTWTSRTSAYGTYSCKSVASDNQGNFLIASYNGVANTGFAQSSSDGTTWTARGQVSTDQPEAICHSSGKPGSR